MRHFDGFAFDETTQELWRDGRRLALAGKAAQLLALLTERPGQLLTRQQLHQALWAQDTFVDFDNNLNVAVRRLRQALDDSASTPRYIETLPRRGLRFVGTLAISPPGAMPGSSRPRRRMLLAAAALALIVTGGHVFRKAAPAARLVTVRVEGFRNISGDASQDFVSEGLRAELAAAMARRSLLGAPPGHAAPAQAFAVRGTSRRDETGLYVTVELIDTRTETAVWSESFVCPRQDLFLMQRRIAVKIGDEVAAAVTG